MQHKTALITGASKRIGKAIALRLAKEGINIIVHYNKSQNDANELVKQIQTYGVESWTVQTDLSCNNEALQLIHKTKQLTNQIDILINNASIFVPSNLKSLTHERMLADLQVNTLSPLFISQQFEKQNINDGLIINILDTRISQLDLNHAAYLLSKQMLHSLTKMMSLSYAPSIRVNAVAPGLILPPPGKKKEHIIEEYKRNLAEQAGTPGDIASCVLFIVQNTFINGETIYVDGGQHVKAKNYD